MNTVTIEVTSKEVINKRFEEAMQGLPQGNYISFDTVEQLWKTLTPNRWALLRTMAGAGEISIREAARRVHRDIKAVYTDVQILLGSGIIDKKNNLIEFPYVAIHVDFTLSAA